jgi:hypothetical protein
MGLECKKNNFFNLIRNPVYCGKILIPKYKDEETHTVKGLHEAIISESLFYDVQDIINGNKRAEKGKIHSPDLLPLRGFIRCSRCNRVLCGSASKGRNGYYYYYHCSSACGCRYKAEVVNEAFEAQLQQYVIRPDYAELFKEVIVDTYKSQNQTKGDYSRLVKDIDEENNKVRKARELLLGGDIDGGDYKIIKSESEHKIEILEAKLSEVIGSQNAFVDIEPLVSKAVSRLTLLDTIYCQSANCEKRELIGSMYPQKFTFEDLQHRTAKTADLYSFIYLINSELGKKKRRASDKNLCLPSLAPEAGLEPTRIF